MKGTDYWQIADRQGWSDSTCGEMALAFIESRGLMREFVAHALLIAEEENAG